MAIDYLSNKKRFVIDSYGKYFSDERITNIFIENKIRFTPPNEFNDPLEFKPTLKGNKLHDVYIFRDKQYPSKADIITVSIIGYLSEKYGVLSLTKVPDSFYMWSLYANGHKGFFIVFKDNFNLQPSLLDGDLHYSINKVSYTNKYCLNSNVNYIDLKYANNFALSNHEKIFFTKIKRWSFEKEYRMVRPLKDITNKLEKSLFDFDLNYISDIVFGASMSIKNKFLIKEKCGNRDVKFYQSMIVKDDKDYEKKLGKVIIWKIPDDIPWEILKEMSALHFCADLEALKSKKINLPKLEDLPYPPERVVAKI